MEAVQKGEVSIEYVEKKREEIKTENKEQLNVRRIYKKSYTSKG